ncbi:MAG: YgiQ family radical SAM protein [Turneriella sp.]|nr:YgiQ family radical SAM protein [Turneriella sp.]
MPELFDTNRWLPITVDDLHRRGLEVGDLDVILISGDAYVDHPSFGHAVIGRLIEAEGFNVAIIPQPNWRDDLRDFKKFGAPRLFFGVTSGCMDSMVNHYTARKRRRSSDAYTPGGEAHFRPDYAAYTYSKILKQLYPDVPVVLGGIEASLRRVTHYDYWSDTLKPTILAESGADLLVYGMAEEPLREILRLLKRGVPFENINTVPQTALLSDKVPVNKSWQDVEIVSHEECLADKKRYASNFKTIERESNKFNARRILQKVGTRTLVINPPYPPMDSKQIDRSFEYPYTRMPHPKYRKRGAIPAYEMIKFSINTHRGCFGGCSFCTISAHQGKFIASRSQESVARELETLTQHPEFKGVISDMGGPSANMYQMQGKDLSICERCSAPSCIFPKVCKNLDVDHSSLTEIYRLVKDHPKVKHAFVGSGVRYDLLVPKDDTHDQANGLSEYTEKLIRHHVSGRLKVAPEHTADHVLKIMRKPSFKLFHAFKKQFQKISDKVGKKQELIPYFISSHPGTSSEDMANLACETNELGFHLEQVQDFTPTPMTVATEIYYSGVHPYTGKPVSQNRDERTKKLQNLFFFWYKKENRGAVQHELSKIGRPDLWERLTQRKRI